MCDKNMISKILKEICDISDDTSINVRNYIDALNYIDRLYRLVTAISNYYSISKITFLPTFKSFNLANELGIATTTEENELKLIKLKSKPLFEDETKLMEFKEELVRITENVIFVDDLLIITLL